jgi:hypothetical protein
MIVRYLLIGAALAILSNGWAIAGKPTSGTQVVFTITELHADSDGRASAINNLDDEGALSIVGRTATAAGDKNAALSSATANGVVLGLADWDCCRRTESIIAGPSSEKCGSPSQCSIIRGFS